MGHRSSRHKHDEKPTEAVVTQVQDPLGDRVVVALQEARNNPNRRSDLSFDKLLLKFPYLRSGFDRLRNVFSHRQSRTGQGATAVTGLGGPHIEERVTIQAPTGRDMSKPVVEERITIDEAEEALVRIGVKANDADLDRAFAAAHKDDPSATLDFNEFLTALAVLILQMGPDNAIAQGADRDAVEAIMLAVDSFNHFDKDASGYLHRDEVLGTLREVDKPAHAPRTGEPAASPIQQRWQQLDWDRDGRVNLKEYFAALCTWVMEDEEAEEDL